jgi:anthranilate synthase/aminodeoxychorismate synthase-like glutamine amidotransferase
MKAMLRFSGMIPILGVCLGHQSIVAAFGGEHCWHASRLMHGKTSQITSRRSREFTKRIRKPFEAMRYHSLVASRDDLPDCLTVITSRSEDGEIMGVRHVSHPTEGIQFHPESIMTPCRQAIAAQLYQPYKGKRKGTPHV